MSGAIGLLTRISHLLLSSNFLVNSVSSYLVTPRLVSNRRWIPSRPQCNDARIDRIPFLVKASNTPDIEIRDWKKGDGQCVRDFWLLESLNSSILFDPEGSLTLDLLDVYESYTAGDNGCFLIARKTDESRQIIGTAGLIVGTPVAYFQSGSSFSSFPKVTAAIRRVCFRTSDLSIDQMDDLWMQIVARLESNALSLGATEIIGLAFKNEVSNGSFCRPDARMYEASGFQRLPSDQQIVGLEKHASQYTKSLSR